MDVQEQVEDDWTLEREYRFSVFVILEPFASAWCILVNDMRAKERIQVATRLLYILTVAVALLATACSSASALVAGSEKARASGETGTGNGAHLECPATQPPDPAFVPPSPCPAQPPGEDRFWFGQAGLWTALPSSGSWAQLARGEKFWWWSEEFDVSKDETPDLEITARRLDGPAPAVRVTEATNGYHESFNWAMLAGVHLPEPGCWEFTGQYQGHQLSLKVWVPLE
jgi:hypothetical protein